MKQELQKEFPQEIKSVYYQNWVAGVRGGGGGTDFYIEFRKPFSSEIKLYKLYFRNQESNLEDVTNTSFVAHFYQNNINTDLILDKDSLKEYGNKTPVIIKPKFDLKPNEAVLEYKKKNQLLFFKIVNLKEKPIIAYPSINKPRN